MKNLIKPKESAHPPGKNWMQQNIPEVELCLDAEIVANNRKLSATFTS